MDFECGLVKELEEQRLPEEWAEKSKPVCVVPNLQVYCNGLMQVENVDYTVKVGNDGNPFITFSEPIAADSDVQITYKVAQNVKMNVSMSAAMAKGCNLLKHFPLQVDGFNLNDFVPKQ